MLFFFFFQAEDGIRDKLVTGVQTCALPILVGIGEVWRSLSLIPAGFPSSFARRIGQPILRAPSRPSGPQGRSGAKQRSWLSRRPMPREILRVFATSIFREEVGDSVMPVTSVCMRHTAS